MIYSIKETKKTQLLVIGGGTAGISVSSILAKTNQVTIIDPSDKHYYQPGWTLSGGGLYDHAKTEKNMSQVLPKGAEHLKDVVVSVDPDTNSVQTKGGVTIEYEYLFVCAGLQTNWDQIIGLEEALDDNDSRVCSNYSFKYAPKTARIIKLFKRGEAVFTYPASVVKCAGAPQKIMYIADHIFKRNHVNAKVHFYSGMQNIFGVPYYRPALDELIVSKGIDAHFEQDLVEVRGKTSEAIFKNVKTGQETIQKFSLLHVTPKMGPPDFLKGSKLANVNGYVEVDKHTLQHVRYPNVFSLGDASSLPTSKTAAAISAQAPVAIKNFLSYKTGVELRESYDGYTACPIVTEEGKAILAEFNYELEPQPSIPFMDHRKPNYVDYFFKRHVFPSVYWNASIKGRWNGAQSLPWKKCCSCKKKDNHSHAHGH